MSDPIPISVRKPFGKRTLHALRRAHVYLGLFLFPWAILYGVTAFLFNHPSAFDDRPSATFGRSGLAGTPMENPPAPATVAEAVVTALNARSTDGTTGVLVEPKKAEYTREFAFATVKTDGSPVSILVEVGGSGGTVRSQPTPPAKTAERAPFAIPGPKPPRPEPVPAGEGLAIPDPIHERFRASIPAILARTGFPAGEATVTSVPDLAFRMERGGCIWIVTFNALTGTVAGRPAEDAVAEPITARRFLTRLHTAHGYPTSGGVRWWWAVLVDATAFALGFWGLSGLLMWGQLRAARKLGAAVLALSALAAGALGYGMYAVLVR